MRKIKLNVLGLSYSQTQTGAYALVLMEETGSRRIPIIIGGVEAQAIALQLENIAPPRPLTHDLFKQFSEAFSISILEVNIYKLEEGIFYSELVCQKGSQKVRLDSRTSDAVAIALRFGCPIYVQENIIEKAGIEYEMDGDDNKVRTNKEPEFFEEKSPNDPSYSGYSIPQLENLLNEAITREDYEKASYLRDEITKRKNP
ncbi:MAG: bifunctional nuclease family protein [Marinifilaceae bacterium]|jgi:bifunctional DNase/RNase|nr:bifunctional nuclease family protein [Marinifilaceae bacterium]